MLILTRRPGEFIITELPTGERITVTVLGVKGNQVRIGTDAPDDIAIVREELLEGSQNSIKKASASSGDKTLAGCFLEEHSR